MAPDLPAAVVPCPPLHARLLPARCVETYLSGKYHACAECPLAAQRSAEPLPKWRDGGAAGRGCYLDDLVESRAAGIAARYGPEHERQDAGFLRAIMGRTGLSSHDIAELLDLSDGHVGNVLAGRRRLSGPMSSKLSLLFGPTAAGEEA